MNFIYKYKTRKFLKELKKILDSGVNTDYIINHYNSYFISNNKVNLLRRKITDEVRQTDDKADLLTILVDIEAYKNNLRDTDLIANLQEYDMDSLIGRL